MISLEKYTIRTSKLELQHQYHNHIYEIKVLRILLLKELLL